MNKFKVISTLLFLFVTGPIWFYLVYVCLKGVNAGELAMFLYWIYVPVSLLTATLLRLAEDK